MTAWIPVVVTLPFAGGLVAFVLGGRAAPAAGLVTAIATVVAAFRVAFQVHAGGPQQYAIGGWSAPLGIELYADGLSALMLLITAIAGVCISLYSLGYFPSPHAGEWTEQESFWPLWLMLWGSLNALFLSGDIFNYYVVLEVMTLPAIALITLARETSALTAAVRYLMVAFLGSLLYLLGVALLYAQFGVLDIRALSGRVEPGTAVAAALGLMTIGLLLKTALFPLHFWLPKAHAGAPAPVSALLSALVVKGSFYLLLRLWFGVFAGTIPYGAGQLLGALGACAVFWGGAQALRQERLKLLIAYSTVAQIGYLFLLVPLVMSPVASEPAGAELTIAGAAWSGGIYHVMSHACAKAAMFMAAGTVMHAFGHDRLKNLSGVAESLPATTFAFGLAGVTLMGLPPSGGFVSKWLLVNSAVAAGQWWWAIVLVLGSLLAASYVFMVLRHAFLPKEEELVPNKLPRILEVTTMALALLSVLLGLRTAEPLALLQIGSPFPAPFGPGR